MGLVLRWFGAEVRWWRLVCHIKGTAHEQRSPVCSGCLPMLGRDGGGTADLGVGSPGEAPGSDPQSGLVFVNHGFESTRPFTHEPLLGAVTDSSITIWAHANGPLPQMFSLAVEYGQSGEPGQISPAVSVDETTDFCGTVTLNGFTPQTSYWFRLVVDGAVPFFLLEISLTPLAPASFLRRSRMTRLCSSMTPEWSSQSSRPIQAPARQHWTLPCSAKRARLCAPGRSPSTTFSMQSSWTASSPEI